MSQPISVQDPLMNSLECRWNVWRQRLLGKLCSLTRIAELDVDSRRYDTIVYNVQDTIFLSAGSRAVAPRITHGIKGTCICTVHLPS